jgi:hypothetical protein
LRESVKRMLIPVAAKVIPPSATTSRSNMDVSLEVTDKSRIARREVGRVGAVSRYSSQVPHIR